MAWDRLTSRSKYNLLDHTRLANATTAFSDARHQMLVGVVDDDLKTGSPRTASLLFAVGVDTVITPRHYGTVHGWVDQETGPESPWATEIRWQRAPDELRFAWIVQNASYVAMPSVLRPDDLVAAIDTVYFPDGIARNLQREVVLETNDVSDISWHHVPSAGGAPGTCQVEEASYDRFTVRTNLSRPGWLVLRQGDPRNWRCERLVDDQPVEQLTVRRANFNMQTVHLPAGQHHLRFRYRPTSFRIGSIVSVLSIVVLVGLVIRRNRLRPIFHEWATKGCPK